MSDPRHQLEQLLAESVTDAAERERTEFDRLTASTPAGLVIFGAGNMGRTIARKLRQGVTILAFADNDRALWGQTVEGLPVLSPQDAAARYGESAAFVIAIWAVSSRDRMAARVSQLRGLGCRCVITFPALFWKYPDRFLPHCVVDQPRKVLAEAEDVMAAYDLWADEFSRREYVAQIQWRLRGDFDSMADPVRQTVYFPADLFRLSEDEVFIDCGAFDGDTVRSFLFETGSRFQRIFAFEPDPLNYRRLCESVQALAPEIAARIETRELATAASDCRMRFAATGTDGSAIGSGDIEVEVVSLDRALAGVAPTHLKMDIEGTEPDALAGARGLIAKHAPVLAICAYHRQSDLWRIPNLIHEIRGDYRFYIRPHLIEGWDTVCYAVPPKRCLA